LDFWKTCADFYDGPILEMSCGTGRILLPLSQLGYDITGVDISNPMLAELKQKILNCPHDVRCKIHLIQGNMVDKILSGNYNLIIFAVSTFLALKNDDERLACLKSCNQVLSDNGVIILSNSKFETNIIRPTALEEANPEKEIIIEYGNDKKN